MSLRTTRQADDPLALIDTIAGLTGRPSVEVAALAGQVNATLHCDGEPDDIDFEAMTLLSPLIKWLFSALTPR